MVHIAGVINARDAAAFEAGNVAGTLAMLAAATAAGTTRFVHVSSLAAREPKLSRYGASKARAEELVEGSGLDWAIVRPPAVYGPGDKETLELFKMARLRLMLLPPKGRLSMIHVDDLCRLLLALAQGEEPRQRHLSSPTTAARAAGATRSSPRALGLAVGRRNLSLSVPAAMLRLGAAVDQLVRREKAKLSPDRAAYFSHRDWVADPSAQAARRAVVAAGRDRAGPCRNRPLVCAAGLAVRTPCLAPHCVAKRGPPNREQPMTDRDETYAKIRDLIDPFNKKGAEVSEDTRFQQDLEWDSLTVMDFVASVEDEFDILISMNRAAEIETVGQLVDAVGQLRDER